MPRDKTVSHLKVLAAARQEFIEYGFQDASMRRIGRGCGMTAAGLYRHCRNKEALFQEVVKPSIDRIHRWLEDHISRSIDSLESDEVDLWKDSEIDMMRDVIYPNMEEYRLLLTGARGTCYEDFLHDFARMQQEKMVDFMPLLKEKGYAVREVSPRELHLLLSAYTTALFEPVIHGYSLEEAYSCLEVIEDFFLPGWKKLLGV